MPTRQTSSIVCAASAAGQPSSWRTKSCNPCSRPGSKKAGRREQIKGRESLAVSVTTIYRAVQSGRLSFDARKHLRRRGKPGTGGLVTVVDRKARLLLAAKIEDRTAAAVQFALIRLLDGLECRSLTTDNGKEFARHREISAALGAPVYFAHPHSPWERGTNENTNGLIREYLPRGLDFRGVRNDDVLRIVERLNKRPGKCPGFRTPREAFFNFPVAFGLTI